MNPITVKQEGDRYIARFQFDHATKDFVKTAGFKFDGTRKVWWTDKAEIAARLATPEAAEKWVAEANEKAREQAARDAAAIEASRKADADIAVPAPAGLSYLPYQRAGIAYGMERAGVLIGDEMGLGKTIQGIGIANADPDARRVLIICPASLKLNWAREWQKWDVKRLSVGIANGAWVRGDPAVVIVNYENVGKHRDRIDAIAWDLLIVDECHYLKNPKAQRTKAVFGGKGATPITARRRVFLTGTPVVNRPIELWPLVESLDPAGLGKHFMGFAKRYCAAYHNGYGWDFSGASNLDELQAKLRAACMVRRLKADVLTDLPPKRRSVIVIPPTAEQAKVIARETAAMARHEEELRRLRVAAELAKAAEDTASYEAAVAKLREGFQLAFEEMSAARREVAIAKAPTVIEHVQALLEETPKIVLMAHHYEVVDQLREAFGDAAVHVDGRVPVEHRQAAVDRFQGDPTCRVFVGTIRAAGVGLTLTASSTVVFAELDWVPGNVSQAEDRCHRIGQRNMVTVHHVVLDGSLDVRMATVLVEKQDVIDRALDRDAATPEAEEMAVPVFVEPAPKAAPEEKPATVNVTRKQIIEEAETLTPDQVAAIHTALQLLAGMDEDGARDLNGIGFNKMDTGIGRALAAAPSLTPRQAALGRKIVVKYRRQYPAGLLARIKGEPVAEAA